MIDPIHRPDEEPSSRPDEPGQARASRARFRTTIWTQVLNARDADEPRSRQALESLCESYWFPIYSYVRQRGYSFHDAQDLTQGFFAEILAKKHLKRLKNRAGKFRSFLLNSLRWFLANEWDRRTARKRGGDFAHVSMDAEDMERWFQTDADSGETPEHNFDRQFARTGLRRAMKRLRGETDETLLNTLGPYLVPQGGEATYREVATKLQMSETAVKSAVRRLRRRCGELFRSEIEDTVATDDDIDEEVRYLLSLLARR